MSVPPASQDTTASSIGGSPPSIKIVKPSSLRKKRKERGSAPSKKGHNFFTLHHVRGGPTENHVCGFLIQFYGYAEKASLDPLYTRNDPVHAVFIANVEPILRVFPLFDLTTNRRVQNDNGYDVRCLGFSCRETDTRATLEQFMNDTFIPAFFNMGKVRAGTQLLPHPTNPYVQYSHWREVLEINEVFRMLTLEDDYAGQGGLAAYFQGNRARLYSIWPHGEVPLDVIDRFRLRQEHLNVLDWTRHANAIAAEAAAQANAAADAAGNNP